MTQKRSLFGPLALIAAGVIWLLVRGGTIPSANLWALTHVWPFLLIAAGVGIILRSYWAYTSIVLDVLIVGGISLAILFAPQLGWASPSMVAFGGDGDFFFGPGERGSGNVIKETREVSGFDSVAVDYPARVFITQGNKESLQIEADDNFLPGLRTEVKNGSLHISYKSNDRKHVNPTRTPVINITVRNLSDVSFSSAGELTIDGIETDSLGVSLDGAGSLKLEDVHAPELSISMSGAGSMSASGSTDDLSLSISGFGDFKGSELHGKTANVSISGAGSATVWVDSQLDAEISGAGSVNYYGDADVTQDISGVGSVKHLGSK